MTGKLPSMFSYCCQVYPSCHDVTFLLAQVLKPFSSQLVINWHSTACSCSHDKCCIGASSGILLMAKSNISVSMGINVDNLTCAPDSATFIAVKNREGVRILVKLTPVCDDKWWCVTLHSRVRHCLHSIGSEHWPINLFARYIYGE